LLLRGHQLLLHLLRLLQKLGHVWRSTGEHDRLLNVVDSASAVVDSASAVVAFLDARAAGPAPPRPGRPAPLVHRVSAPPPSLFGRYLFHDLGAELAD